MKLAVVHADHRTGAGPVAEAMSLAVGIDHREVAAADAVVQEQGEEHEAYSADPKEMPTG